MVGKFFLMWCSKYENEVKEMRWVIRKMKGGDKCNSYGKIAKYPNHRYSKIKVVNL